MLPALLLGVLLLLHAATLAVDHVAAQSLAAAGATPLGPAPASPRGAARQAAALHGAALLRCCGATEVLPPRVEVVAGVMPRTALARALRGQVVRRAAASLRPGKTVLQPSGFAPLLPNSDGNGAAQGPRR